MGGGDSVSWLLISDCLGGGNGRGARAAPEHFFGEDAHVLVDIGDTLYPSHGGSWMPPILFDGVSVATKG